jgi:predicted ester cyclase/ketosteroid isomerase-like protein
MLRGAAAMAMLRPRAAAQRSPEPFTVAAQALRSAVMQRDLTAIANLHSRGARVSLPSAAPCECNGDAQKAWDAFLRSSAPATNQITFDRTEVGGSLAVGEGRWQAEGPAGTDASGRFVSAWKSVNGKWRIQNFTATGPADLEASLELKRQRALHFVYQIVNRNNMMGAENYVSPDFGERMASLGTLRGVDALKVFMDRLKGIFPDLQYSIEEVVAGKNGVAMRMTGRGTHQGVYVGIEPTGKHIQFRELIFLQLRQDSDGQEKIVHWEVMPDRLAMVYFLGHTHGVTYSMPITEPGPELR